MAIDAADWSVDKDTKVIDYIGDDHTRFGGAAPTYASGIEFHRWVQGLADDATYSGDDEMDITIVNASERLGTDNIFSLLNGWTLTDRAIEHLYDCSIIQSNGNTIYDGIVNVLTTDDIQIFQNGSLIARDFWNTGAGGLNADAAAGISHKFLIKVRDGGTDIDGRRLIGLTRNYLNSYQEFKINGTTRGNNVLALGEALDNNNATAASTVEGWSSIVVTQGYSSIDADGDTTPENYYSDIEYGSQSVNDVYERAKWLSQSPQIEDSYAGTGSDFVVDNATITGAAQSFANGATAMFVTKVAVKMKAVASPTGNVTASIYSHTGTFGSTGTPNAIVGSASDAVDAADIASAYQTVIFQFSTPVPLAASTNYFLVIEHPNGDGTNYLHIQGLATSGAHAGNRAHNTAGWTAVAADDLRFEVYTSPQLFGLPGSVFRGVTHQIAVDTPTGTFSAVERVSWTGGTGQMLAINSTTAATLMWIQLLTGVAPTDGQTITGATSSATVDVNVTVTERTINANLPWIGQSTGTAIIGNYGVGVGADDLTQADKVTDLTGTQRTPPNNVTFTVTGLASGEDRILVTQLGYRFAYDNEASGPFTVGETLTFSGASTGTAVLHALQDDGTTGWMVVSEPVTGTVPVNNAAISGGTSGATADVNGTPVPDIAVRQFTLQAALTTDNITAVQINTSVPGDTPSTGTIRVQDNNGLYRILDFDQLDAADTFSITTTNGNEDFATVNASAGNNVFISYIDKLAASTQESFTGVYQSDRNLFVRARDGAGTPTKPQETTGTLGSAGGSATITRQSDE